MKTIVHAAVLAIIATASLSGAQTAGSPRPPLEYKLEDFRVTDVTFPQAIAQVSFLPLPNLHLGFEEILRDNPTDPRDSGPRFSVLLRNATLRQVLDSLCAYDSRYVWSQDGMTINIYPKTTADDAGYLLNRGLQRITIADIPEPEQALRFLDEQLPPPREQLGYAGVGGDSQYELPWSQTFENVTVRQFINRLSEHMGAHTSWIFYGSKRERMFTFVKGGFH